MHALAAAIKKEFLIILRDREALAILFVMPAIFVLIMSLAMQDAFNEQAGVRFSTLIINKDHGRVGDAVVRAFDEQRSFEVTTLKDEPLDLQQQMTAGKYRFAVVIPESATSKAGRHARQLLSTNKTSSDNLLSILLLADPTLRGDHRSVAVATLNRVLLEIEKELLITQMASGFSAAPSPTKKPMRIFNEIRDPYENTDSKTGSLPTPTSVQQNAPGWGLLAMFFLVIPLAGTLIREHREGNVMRLQTMAAPMHILLAGKMVPYFVINQIQIVLILLEGMFLLPLLGGERLELGPHPLALIPISASVSIAAVSYGLMISAFCRTAEQATVFGATSILILGAIGGIMVPKMVMPATMQAMTALSPMAWGLDAFLAVFVRGSDALQILPQTTMMLGFGIICLSIAVIRFQIRLNNR